MQPIKYDTNCKACHPLTFDAAVKGTDGKPFALPHGKPLSETEGMLESAYFNAAIRGNAAEFRGWLRPPGLRPLPGRSIDSGKAPAVLEGVALLDMVKKSASGAATVSEGKQGGLRRVPHNRKQRDRADQRAGRLDEARAGSAMPPMSRPYLVHRTATAGATDSTVNSDVLMPDVKSCRRPATRRLGWRTASTSAALRFECTTCHTFHHGGDNTNSRPARCTGTLPGGRWSHWYGVAGTLHRAERDQDQGVPGLITMAKRSPSRQFLLCVKNDAYPHLAGVGQERLTAPFPDAAAVAKGFVRVIDESGEDYLYPADHFVAVELPKEAVDALLAAS